MKTRIKIKASRNTRYSKALTKLAIKIKETQKQKKQKLATSHRDINQKIHKFYIVRCNNGLDHTILYRILQSLGLVPDSNAMNYVEKQYNKIIFKNKLSRKQFCESYNKNFIVKIPSGLVKADVIFYHINSNLLDKPFYKYSKFLTNTINLDFSMLDKGMLYINIIKYNSRRKLNLNNFIKIFALSNNNKFKFPGNYILRPINGFGGSGILYVHNLDDLTKAIKYYNTHKDVNNHPYSLQEITVSRIITDLLLFKGRKFHLRMYYIVAILEGEISCFLLDKGKILTAKDPYNLEVPFSKGVHDTHLDSTDADYFFPNDLTPENIHTGQTGKDNDNHNLKNIILEGIREIAKGISNIVFGSSNGKPNSLLFEHQQNGYYIYGLDILVRDNLELVLVECNNNTGFECHTLEKKKMLSEIIYQWINEIILEPLFKHPGMATSYSRKHKTYISLDD
jgi:hypothetical protein